MISRGVRTLALTNRSSLAFQTPGARVMDPDRDSATSLSPSEFDARIQPGVGDIDDDVDEQITNGCHQDRSLDQWKIAPFDCVDGELPDSLPGEDGFSDHRAAQQRAELQANDGNDRNQRVAQPVGD